MWADISTKEKHLLSDLEDVCLENVMDIPETTINDVKAIGTEIRMDNVRNHRVEDSV